MPTPLTFFASHRPLPGLVLLLTMACSVQLQTAPAQQPRTPGPATGLYRIAGTVVNAVTGAPVRHATVAALTYADSRTVASVESGDDGRFALDGLSAAKYQLTASRRGFHTGSYDEHEGFSTAIVTGPEQETEGLTFRLTPGAILRGVVTADGGDPVERAQVMLFRKPRANGPEDRITQAGAAITDDTGAFDFADLAAGEYLLAVKAEPWYALHHSANRARDGAAGGAEMNTALDVAYPVTYFDSTTDEGSATPIVLTGGSREEADINLHAVPALHLVVETPRKPDGAIAQTELRQIFFGAQVSAESHGFPDAMRTGTTEFTGVAPGHYELAQGDPPRIAELDATASQQIDPSLGTPTVSLSATVRTDSGGEPPDVETMSLESANGAPRSITAQGPIRRGGSGFQLPAVPPGDWNLLAFGPGKRWTVVATSVNGETHPGNLLTVRDRSLSVVATVSEGATRVQGFARKTGAPGDRSSSLGWKDGKGVAGVMVVLVPKRLADMQVLARRDQSDSDGSFSLQDVVPGRYTVVAIQDGWDLDWSRPEVIARYLPGGVAVSVTGHSGKLLQLAAAVPVQPR